VEHLREVFAALRGAGVSLEAKNCHLFQEEVEYLGHILGPGIMHTHIAGNESDSQRVAISARNSNRLSSLLRTPLSHPR